MKAQLSHRVKASAYSGSSTRVGSLLLLDFTPFRLRLQLQVPLLPLAGPEDPASVVCAPGHTPCNAYPGLVGNLQCSSICSEVEKHGRILFVICHA